MNESINYKEFRYKSNKKKRYKNKKFTEQDLYKNVDFLKNNLSDLDLNLKKESLILFNEFFIKIINDIVYDNIIVKLQGRLSKRYTHMKNIIYIKSTQDTKLLFDEKYKNKYINKNLFLMNEFVIVIDDVEYSIEPLNDLKLLINEQTKYGKRYN